MTSGSGLSGNQADPELSIPSSRAAYDAAVERGDFFGVTKPQVRLGLQHLWNDGKLKATDLNWYELEMVTPARLPDPLASWRPVDLGPYLRGEVKPAEPSVGWPRADGVKLLYPGKEHSIFGEMESGKSWFLCACAAWELTNGNHVVYVHFEEADPAGTIERILALGASAEQVERALLRRPCRAGEHRTHRRAGRPSANLGGPGRRQRGPRAARDGGINPARRHHGVPASDCQAVQGERRGHHRRRPRREGPGGARADRDGLRGTRAMRSTVLSVPAGELRSRSGAA